MSALCAFPPLISASSGVYSSSYGMAHQHHSHQADASRSFVASMPAYQQQQPQRGSHTNAMTATYHSGGNSNVATFTAFHPAGNHQGGKMQQQSNHHAVKMVESTSSYAPQAKRRCIEPQQQQPPPLWPASTSSVCPSGCTACQQQQYTAYGYDSRRPLQEKHQNHREAQQAALMASAAAAAQQSPLKAAMSKATSERPLSVDMKKDYSIPLHVDCSVEYDLPRIVRPPPGAQPLLVLAPPRPTTAASTSTAYTTWQGTASLATSQAQWNQQASKNLAAVKASAVISHPHTNNKQPQQQQPKMNPISGSVRSSNNNTPCGCPSCCLARPSGSYPPNGASVGPVAGGWMNQWSPQAGTTAVGLNYAYQQMVAAPAGGNSASTATYLDASVTSTSNSNATTTATTAVNPRRRKRSPELPAVAPAASADKIQRLYASPWMPMAANAAAAEAAFLFQAAQQAAATRRYHVASSPAAWITASAQPLKFHC